jgi:hypothetical protein
MLLNVVCSRCHRSFETDDFDGFPNQCPFCCSEWICNADAEPEYAACPEDSATEYEFPEVSLSQLSPENLSISGGQNRSGEQNLDWQRMASRSRPRRRPSSLLSQILPPILGGLSALPIALAILWYGFGRDIGNAGPTVAKFAPWIVPEPLRGYQGRKQRIRGTQQPTRTSRGEWGSLGSRFEPSSPFPSDRDTSEPLDQIARDIITLRDDWESEPSEPWSQVQNRILQHLQRLAKVWEDSRESQASRRPAPKALRRLIGLPWFVESVEQANSDWLEYHPPAPWDRMVWPIRAVEWDMDHSATNTIFAFDPAVSIGSRKVQWICDEIIAAELRRTFETPNRQQALLVGLIERADELGYVIRIEAVLVP